MKSARLVRQFTHRMWSILVGLVVSGKLVLRVNPGQTTARGVFQFSVSSLIAKREATQASFLAMLLELFSSFCSSG